MNQKIRLITVSSFALLGILCISSGTMYSKLQQKNVKQITLKDGEILIEAEKRMILF